MKINNKKEQETIAKSLGRDFIGFLVKELTKEKVLPTFLLVLGKVFILPYFEKLNYLYFCPNFPVQYIWHNIISKLNDDMSLVFAVLSF